MIAFKYATLSEGEYKRIIKCTFEEIIDEYQNQLQLITGWLAVYPAFIDYEIDASARRIDADLDNQVFHLPDPSISPLNKVLYIIYYINTLEQSISNTQSIQYSIFMSTGTAMCLEYFYGKY